MLIADTLRAARNLLATHQEEYVCFAISEVLDYTDHGWSDAHAFFASMSWSDSSGEGPTVKRAVYGEAYGTRPVWWSAYDGEPEVDWPAMLQLKLGMLDLAIASAERAGL